MRQLTIWDIMKPEKKLEEMTNNEIAVIIAEEFNAKVFYMFREWRFKTRHCIVTISIINNPESKISVGVDCKPLLAGSFFCAETIEEAIESIQKRVDRYEKELKKEGVAE